MAGYKLYSSTSLFSL